MGPNPSHATRPVQVFPSPLGPQSFHLYNGVIREGVSSRGKQGPLALPFYSPALMTLLPNIPESSWVPVTHHDQKATPTPSTHTS